MPPTGEGTSIAALSDSSVKSDCSGFTTSPILTNTSMIGMFLKSPMSGVFTSTFATVSSENLAAGSGWLS